MAKEDLKPVRTKEEAKERGRAGGKKSGEVRRRKKSMKEDLQLILDLIIDKEKIETPDEILTLADLQKTNITVQQAILLGQIEKAVKYRDTQGATFIRDTSGNKPKDEVAVEDTRERTKKLDNILDQLKE